MKSKKKNISWTQKTKHRLNTNKTESITYSGQRLAKQLSLESKVINLPKSNETIMPKLSI